MEPSRLCTPTSPSQNSSNSEVSNEAAYFGPRKDVSSPALGKGYQTTAIAANRLIDFSRGAPPKRIRKRSLSSATTIRAHSEEPQGTRGWIRQRSLSLQSGRSGNSATSSTTAGRTDLGDPGKPIVHFRPQLWKHIERSRVNLDLDLFWPQKFDDSVDAGEEIDDESHYDKRTFPLRGLLPLCEFRCLRSLRLGGLMQSYQIHIWRACWVNPELVELILEMALEPVMNESSPSWVPIDGTWSRKNSREAFTGYLGMEADGSLCDSVGTGEYLDKGAISSARRFVSSQSVNLRHLPIVKLVLAGFVVDAGPFFRWFNPTKLRSVGFSYGCVDAGFALPFSMSDLVTVSWPENLPQETKLVTVSRVSQKHIKTVYLGHGSCKKRQSGRGLKPRLNSVMTTPWLPNSRARNIRVRMGDNEHQRQRCPATHPRRSSIKGRTIDLPKPVR